MARTDGGCTRAEQAHRRLREDILGGRLTPGQRLKFPELGQRCGVSVGAIREALARLSAEGLVRAQPHLGFVVTPLSHEELAELTTARVEIESLVLHHAVQQGDMAWEAAAVAAHHVLERTPMTQPDDPRRVTDAWSKAHEDFHIALLVGCQNRKLRTIACSLREEAELYRRWSVSFGNEPDRNIAGEHRALLQASLDRDADLAAERLRDHVAHTAQLLISCAEDEPVALAADKGAR